ncbi:MAG: hypothetical protein ACYCXW_22930 [Solirubrobacteraceae bacterium]
MNAPVRPAVRRRPGSGPRPDELRPLGGTEGNERLTVITGHLLIVLLAVLGVTIVGIGQLMWLHLFIGLLLLGPIALKLASTGYRFVRYYTANPRYRRKGPPAPALRLLAPAVVGLTVAVFATGVALLLTGPNSSAFHILGFLHKASFILWLGATAIHVAGHIPELVRFNSVPARTRAEIGELRAQVPGFGAGTEPPPRWVAGNPARLLSLAGALVVGLVLAVSLTGHFGVWTSWRHGGDGGVSSAALQH